MTDLEKAAQEFRAATAALDAARDRLATAIVAAANAGTRQAEIVRTTGYTRETVRRICRDAGAPAAAE
jgi:predicted transcriptional regulator